MENKTMSTSAPGQMRTGQLEAASQKAFSRGSDDSPSPKYVNNIEFTASGMDVFMDAGTVSPESVRDAMEMKSSGKTPTVRFNIDFRFGMSLQTAIFMHRRLTELLKAHTDQVMKESAETPAEGNAPIKDV